MIHHLLQANTSGRGRVDVKYKLVCHLSFIIQIQSHLSFIIQNHLFKSIYLLSFIIQNHLFQADTSGRRRVDIQSKLVRQRPSVRRVDGHSELGCSKL